MICLAAILFESSRATTIFRWFHMDSGQRFHNLKSLSSTSLGTHSSKCKLSSLFFYYFKPSSQAPKSKKAPFVTSREWSIGSAQCLTEITRSSVCVCVSIIVLIDVKGPSSNVISCHMAASSMVLLQLFLIMIVQTNKKKKYNKTKKKKTNFVFNRRFLHDLTEYSIEKFHTDLRTRKDVILKYKYKYIVP